MNRRWTRMIVAAALLSVGSGVGAQEMASDSSIRDVLRERIDGQKQGVGIIVGIIEPKRRRIFAYGRADQNDPRPLNGDTLFEIGSVTKVFTSLLLADMVQRGELKFDDPIGKYLPSPIKSPERNGKQITLLDLATHTSGLPRLPSNLRPKDLTNPYADYSIEQLYQFLSSYSLTRDIGVRYEYSNLGFGLLGHLLERKTGKSFEALVKSRIAGPLQMSSTTVSLTPELAKRLATGHDAELKRAANWDLPTLAGAGALRSTTNDLLKLLAACLALEKSKLSDASALTLSIRRPTEIPQTEVALAWHVTKSKDSEIVWHNGGTGGYRSFVGFDPKRRVGVVVLSNTATATGVDDIGRHVLDPSQPLKPAPKTYKEEKEDRQRLAGYGGRYELMLWFGLTAYCSAHQSYLNYLNDKFCSRLNFHKPYHLNY